MFIIITNQVCKMLLMLIVGFICSKAGIVSHEGSKSLSGLLLMVVNPLMIFQSFLMDRTPELMHGFLMSFLLSAIIFGMSIVMTNLLFRKQSNPGYAIERFSVVYSNCGFFGIPMVNALLGSEGVFYLTPYMTVFNFLVWTHGLFLMTGRSDKKQLKEGLTSPVIFCVTLGLVFFLTGLRLPPLLNDTLSYLSGMNTPLAMLIAGISLAETDMKSALSNRTIYLVSFVKLLLLPAIVLVMMMLLPSQKMVLQVLLVASACPAATTCTMMALRYHNDYRYASAIFALTTVFAMATIPAVVLMMDLLIG